MLITDPKRARALHIPVLLLFAAVVFLGGGMLGLVVASREGGGVAGGLVGAIVLGGAALGVGLSQLRWFRVEAGLLRWRNVYGSETRELAQVALGMRVRHSSRGGPTYTIYAASTGQDLDLAAAGSKKRAERVRTRLTETLLAGRLDQSKARDAQAKVSERESVWRDQQQQAQDYVADYHASGKAKRLMLWIALGVVVYICFMVAVIYLRS